MPIQNYVKFYMVTTVARNKLLYLRLGIQDSIVNVRTQKNWKNATVEEV